MTKKEIDQMRLIEFIHRSNGMMRSTLTSKGLSNFRQYKMDDFNKLVNSCSARGFLRRDTVHTGKRGPDPVVYTVTTSGLKWAKQKRKENEKLLRRIK